MNKEELKELAATLNGIADGKAWECEAFGKWVTPSDSSYRQAYAQILLARKIRLKPWQLPQPPDGMRWHRDDGWTEEMLPEGWRPSLMWETGDGEVSTNGGKTWRVDNCPDMPVKDYYRDFYRTKRHLPQPQQPDPYAELKAAHAAGKVIQFRFVTENNYSTWRDDKAEQPAFGEEGYEFRIKPEQQKVPLGPSDVPPGSAIRCSRNTPEVSFWQVRMVAEDGVTLFNDEWKWKELGEKNFEINRSIPLTGKWNPEAWEPCYKLIEAP